MANIDFNVQPGGRLQGDIRVPGDKSISHRFVMLAAVAHGQSTACGFLHGEDTLATVAAFRAMGITVEGPEDGQLQIQGAGAQGLIPPASPLDMGNSGTAMRLLSGLLSGQPFASILCGDRSLTQRPMARVVAPLRLMGAEIDCEPQGRPPLHIHACSGHLSAIDYPMPVASAQVKSCLLLAGLVRPGGDCHYRTGPDPGSYRAYAAKFRGFREHQWSPHQYACRRETQCSAH